MQTAPLMEPGLAPIILWYVLAAAMWIGVPGTLIYLALRFVRAHERRSAGSAEVAALAARVAALEDRVGAVAEAVDQIAEGQRFTTAVLTERTPPAGR